MRHWPWIVATLGLLLLSGCLNLGLGQTDGEISPAWFDAVAPRSQQLAGGAVRVVGPQGYCIDPASVADEAPNALAMAPCTALANSIYAGPQAATAVITISVSGTAKSLATLDSATQIAALSSPEGRAALSSQGQAANVSVHNVTGGSDGYRIELSDSALPSTKGLAADHARAVLDVQGHIVTIAAYGLASGRWSSAQSMRLVDQTIQSLRLANGAATPVSEMSPNG